MKLTPFNWACPYCGQSSTITSVNFDSKSTLLNVTQARESDFTLSAEAICCPNPQCEGITVEATFWENGYTLRDGRNHWGRINALHEWQLLPRSTAKPLPDYVPEEIRKNYEEACLIKNDSPKASAAMSRRCLQGIVRDFWEIPTTRRGNLGAEINYIQDKIDDDTLESIKAVREVGDIGAHMEKSVDTIVDVEPEEAALLIELIETLISDWYVAKEKRANRNRALRETVAAKRSAKKASKENSRRIENQANEGDASDLLGEP